MNITTLSQSFGPESADRSADVLQRSTEGARAALETFYFGFNQRRTDILSFVWANESLVQLYNPIGGRVRGHGAIAEVYARIIGGQARVWVALSNIVEYATEQMVVFAGHEQGQCIVGDETLLLSIRTSRVFVFTDRTGWRQAHHHGSIDDPQMLKSYQTLIDCSRTASVNSSGALA